MNEKYSLCNICARLLDCDRASDQNKKVYYCQDFIKAENVADFHNSPQIQEISEKNSNKMKNGLCRICGNRQVCKIKVPNGGIWHCENFI